MVKVLFSKGSFGRHFGIVPCEKSVWKKSLVMTFNLVSDDDDDDVG